jgi:hypothetical protein
VFPVRAACLLDDDVFAGRIGDDPLGDAAEKQRFHRAAPAASKHDHVGRDLIRVSDDLLRRRSLDNRGLAMAVDGNFVLFCVGRAAPDGTSDQPSS